ncbi:Acyl-CoA-binding [Seminavis robusta]|uniref:Acyl-CoA-binding n=1 Tax=Seminavis robusta TaxID=568900 RepID=A0A9N8DE76_9STRA|nr:Acyl-CoA-binding [Seminavis robusta]|eukprot:Sro114_g056250.1 Acyl-CoA-binding (93) ;mRNA; r:20847-21125
MSIELQETFDKAVKFASSPECGKLGLSTNQKGHLYAYFKQANLGDCNGSRPGMFNLVAREKYDAWKTCEGMEKEEAMKKYIAIIEGVAPEFK